MTRFATGFCLLLVLGVMGCGGGKPELGPVNEAPPTTSDADVNKSMQQSMEKMREAGQKMGQQTSIPSEAPAKKGGTN